MLAAIHFFRVYSLMDFGRGKTGRPPSPMWFSAYGGLAFDRVPVLLSGASITWSKDVDYVNVTSTGSASGKPQQPKSTSSYRVGERTAGVPDSPLAGLGSSFLGKQTPSTRSTLPSDSNASSSVPGLGGGGSGGVGGDTDSAWVPMKLEISGVKLTVQHTPAYWKNTFSLSDFYSGGMVESRETSMPKSPVGEAPQGENGVDTGTSTPTPETGSGSSAGESAPARAPAPARPPSKPVVSDAPPKQLSGGLTRMEAKKAKERAGIKDTDSRKEWIEKFRKRTKKSGGG
jgi:hypothetical protein